MDNEDDDDTDGNDGDVYVNDMDDKFGGDAMMTSGDDDPGKG